MPLPLSGTSAGKLESSERTLYEGVACLKSSRGEVQKPGQEEAGREPGASPSLSFLQGPEAAQPRVPPSQSPRKGTTLTLWQVFGPEDLQTEVRSAEGHADRPKQVAFDVLLVLRRVFSLQLQYNQS